MTVINENFHLKDAGISNAVDTVNAPRHRWYYYKEGFSPGLVEKAIEIAGLRKGDVIFDPFNGGGTTTLTASLLQHKSIGIDVNPFTCFLASAKLRNMSHKNFSNHKAELEKAITIGSESDLIGYSTFSERETIDKWLFNEEVLRAFEGGWRYLDKIKPCATRQLLKLALISTAMQNCNATRDGKCLRYRSSWKDNGFNGLTFANALKTKLNDIEEDIQNHPISQRATVLNGDARLLISQPIVENFKLCITSPPYLNTFDYTDIYRPELFLGKFVTDTKGLYQLRLQTVRSHVQAKWSKPTLNDFGHLYNETIVEVLDNKDSLMDKNIPLMIQAYFEDMFKVLQHLKAKASKQASLWIVVSNSAYAGIEVPVDLIIGDIGSKAGWYLKEIGVLRYLKKRITKHSSNITQLRESLIVFTESKQRVPLT
jgi:DNA modification methylase